MPSDPPSTVSAGPHQGFSGSSGVDVLSRMAVWQSVLSVSFLSLIRRGWQQSRGVKDEGQFRGHMNEGGQK